MHHVEAAYIDADALALSEVQRELHGLEPGVHQRVNHPNNDFQNPNKPVNFSRRFLDLSCPKYGMSYQLKASDLIRTVHSLSTTSSVLSRDKRMDASVNIAGIPFSHGENRSVFMPNYYKFRPGVQ